MTHRVLRPDQFTVALNFKKVKSVAHETRFSIPPITTGRTGQPKDVVETKTVIVNCLRGGMNIESSAKIAGVTRDWIYKHMDRDPEFKDMVQQARKKGDWELVEFARKKILGGTASDKLLIFMLSTQVDEFQKKPQMTDEELALLDQLMKVLFQDDLFPDNPELQSVIAIEEDPVSTNV